MYDKGATLWLKTIINPISLECHWNSDNVHCVKIRPRKACRYPNLRSFVWVSYDKVGGLYSGKLGIRSEARASDLRSYPGLRWKWIKLHLYEGTKVSILRVPAQLADLQGALCVSPTFNFTHCGQWSTKECVVLLVRHDSWPSCWWLTVEDLIWCVDVI